MLSNCLGTVKDFHWGLKPVLSYSKPHTFFRLADVFKRKLKVTLMAVNSISAVIFAWFSCMCVGILPRNKGLCQFDVLRLVLDTFIHHL